MKTIAEVLSYEIQQLEKLLDGHNNGKTIYSEVKNSCLGIAQATIAQTNQLEDSQAMVPILIKGFQSIIDSIETQKRSFEINQIKLESKLEILNRLLKEDIEFRQENDNEILAED